MKNLINILVYSGGGFLAGFLSLVILVLIPHLAALPILASLLISTVIEEFAKLTLLYFLFKLLPTTQVKINYLFAFFFGLSFSTFEFILLLLNNTSIDYTFLNSTIIHIVTTFVLLLSLNTYNKNNNLSVKLFLFLVLAFFIHLCYNLIILKTI